MCKTSVDCLGGAHQLYTELLHSVDMYADVSWLRGI